MHAIAVVALVSAAAPQALEVLPSQHGATVIGVNFADDGGRLYTIDTQRKLVEWDLTRSRGRPVISKPTEYEQADADVSRDGKLFATAESDSEEEKVRLFEVGTGRERELEKAEIAHAVALSPDGSRLAGLLPNKVRVWDTSNGKVVAEWRQEVVPGFMTPLVYSPDGRYVAAGGQSHLSVWEVATGQEVLRQKSRITVYRVTFSPDGRHVAWAGHLKEEESDVGTADLNDPRPSIRKVPGCVLGLAYSPDAAMLAIGVGDGPEGNEIQLWETLTGRMITRSPSLKAWPTALAFSPRARSVAAGLMDSSVLVWDITRRE